MLNRSEYDASYFDGALQANRHNAGYSYYNKEYITSTYINNELVVGNIYDFISLDILNRYSVGNKKVLVLACAKGYLVEALVNRGIDAYGIDWSSYAINEGKAEMPLIADRLTLVDDLITTLPSYNNNSFALTVMRHALCCFTDAQVSQFVTEINRVSRDQFYGITENAPQAFYNPKTMEQWRDQFPWKQGTVFAKSTGEWVVK